VSFLYPSRYLSSTRTKTAQCFASFSKGSTASLSDALFACPHSNPPVPAYLENSKTPFRGAASCWKFEPDYHGVADVVHMMLFGGHRMRTVRDADSGRVQVVSTISNYKSGKMTWDKLLLDLVNLDVATPPDLGDAEKLLGGLAGDGTAAGALEKLSAHLGTPQGLVSARGWARVLERDAKGAGRAAERGGVWKAREEKHYAQVVEERVQRREQAAEDRIRALEAREGEMKRRREEVERLAEDLARRERAFEEKLLSFVSPELLRRASIVVSESGSGVGGVGGGVAEAAEGGGRKRLKVGGEALAENDKENANAAPKRAAPAADADAEAAPKRPRLYNDAAAALRNLVPKTPGLPADGAAAITPANPVGESI
jgi:hypothetical protein